MITAENVSCTLELDTVVCNGTSYVYEDNLSPDSIRFWVQLVIFCVLVFIAGLMSGLTYGLLTMDIMSLTVMIRGGTPKEQKYAKKILPLVKQFNLTLVTLLIANVAAYMPLPNFISDKASPVVAIIVSVIVYILLGEVVPQVIFTSTKYGRVITAKISPLIWLLIALTSPVSWPLAKLLDCMGGPEQGTFFRRSELRILVDMHKDSDKGNEDPLTKHEARIIQGALSFHDKSVAQVYTAISNVYSLDMSTIVDKETMRTLINKGYSTVPVHEGQKDCLKGLILVRNLITIDADENICLRDVFFEYCQELLKVCESTGLYECLDLFQTKKKRMFAVVKKSYFPPNQTGSLSDNDVVIGIITLEDLIQELFQEEKPIDNETDVYVDVNKHIKVSKAHTIRNSISRFFSKKQVTTPEVYETNDDERPLMVG